MRYQQPAGDPIELIDEEEIKQAEQPQENQAESIDKKETAQAKSGPLTKLFSLFVAAFAFCAIGLLTGQLFYGNTLPELFSNMDVVFDKIGDISSGIINTSTFGAVDAGVVNAISDGVAATVIGLTTLGAAVAPPLAAVTAGLAVRKGAEMISKGGQNFTAGIASTGLNVDIKPSVPTIDAYQLGKTIGDKVKHANDINKEDIQLIQSALGEKPAGQLKDDITKADISAMSDVSITDSTGDKAKGTNHFDPAQQSRGEKLAL